MKASVEKTDTGNNYLMLDASNVTWHSFPAAAEIILSSLHATDITNFSEQKIVDMHWYEFSWNNNKFRLIYEDWPHSISIEPIDKNNSTPNLLEIQKLLQKII